MLAYLDKSRALIRLRTHQIIWENRIEAAETEVNRPLSLAKTSQPTLLSVIKPSFLLDTWQASYQLAIMHNLHLPTYPLEISSFFSCISKQTICCNGVISLSIDNLIYPTPVADKLTLQYKTLSIPCLQIKHLHLHKY